MKHIGTRLEDTQQALALCDKIVKDGEWMAGAAYQGLMILGGKANDWCPECQRAWILFINKQRSEK